MIGQRRERSVGHGRRPGTQAFVEGGLSGEATHTVPPTPICPFFPLFPRCPPRSYRLTPGDTVAPLGKGGKLEGFYNFLCVRSSLPRRGTLLRQIPNAHFPKRERCVVMGMVADCSPLRRLRFGGNSSCTNLRKAKRTPGDVVNLQL